MLLTDESRATDGPFSPSDYLPDSPFRRPYWRWLCATWLIATGRRPALPIDDEWVEAARRFQDLSNPSGPVECPRMEPPFLAAVGDALQLWEGASERRLPLEGYLLTREPFEVVAARTALPPATVEAYHALFFAVRPHLAARDWIMAQAIGEELGHGFTQLARAWKYVGYAAGSAALDVAIAVSTGQPLPAGVRNSFRGNPAGEEARFRLRVQLALAAWAAGSPEELQPLLAIHRQAQRSDRPTTGRPEAVSPLGEAMQHFLRAFARPSRSLTKRGRPPQAPKPRAKTGQRRVPAPLPQG